jgi:hypothetical protein
MVYMLDGVVETEESVYKERIKISTQSAAAVAGR